MGDPTVVAAAVDVCRRVEIVCARREGQAAESEAGRFAGATMQEVTDLVAAAPKPTTLRWHDNGA